MMFIIIYVFRNWKKTLQLSLPIIVLFNVVYNINKCQLIKNISSKISVCINIHCSHSTESESGWHMWTLQLSWYVHTRSQTWFGSEGFLSCTVATPSVLGPLKLVVTYSPHIQRTSQLTLVIYSICSIELTMQHSLSIDKGINGDYGLPVKASDVLYGALAHSVFGYWWTTSRITKSKEKQDRLWQ